MKKKRLKPSEADYHDWTRFEKWADNHGIGTALSDWLDWWLCWKAGYNAAMNI